MTLLNAKDQDFVVENVRELIMTSGETGTRFTPDPNAENLYGKNDVPYLGGEIIHLELQIIPVETLTKMGADAVIDVLPEQELKPQDRIEIDGAKYKVLNIEEQNCFGVLSHKTVKLVKHHGS